MVCGSIAYNDTTISQRKNQRKGLFTVKDYGVLFFMNVILQHLYLCAIMFQIYMHGNNMSTLHEYVSKDILPAELGGEGPSFNPSVWSDQLLEESLKTAEDPLNETISDASGNNSDSSSSGPDEKTNSCAQAQVRYV